MAWPSGPGEAGPLDQSSEPLSKQRAGLVSAGEVRRQLPGQCRVIGERVALRRLLDKEIERVDDHEVGDQVDGDGELAGRLGEHQTGHVVAEGSCCQLMKWLLGVTVSE